MPRTRLFAACLPGLEAMLLEEVRALGDVDEATVVQGGVELSGPLSLVYTANLQLGLASQILLRIGTFRAPSFQELQRRVRRVEWSRWVDPGAPLPIRVRARKSRLYHTGAVEERVRGAIEDALGAPTQAGPSTPGTTPPPGATRPTLAVRIDHDKCTLSLDTSGEPLHRRGYRLVTGKAPLREDLARAAVLLSGWDRRSALVDPLMGAGTIPIEAALLATGAPPGAHRPFAFMHAPFFDRRDFDAARERALARRHDTCPPIHGSDRVAGAVRAAEDNATRADVRSLLRLDCAPLSAAPGLAGPHGVTGALVTHPPHGRRLGRGKSLLPLYQTLARLAGSLPAAWRIALVVADRRLVLKAGLALRTELLADHGGVKVRVMVGSRVYGTRTTSPNRSGTRSER